MTETVTAYQQAKLDLLKIGYLTHENPVRYKDYRIYDVGTYPGHRYAFVHQDYDGAPDAKDNRHGEGTMVDCIIQINQIEDEG